MTEWKLSGGPAIIDSMGAWTYDSEWMAMDGYDALVTYKNMRSLRVRIKAPDGDVAVSAPLFTPDHVIEDFLRDRHEWVLEHRANVRLRSVPPEILVTGGRVRLWGTWCEVVVAEAPRATARLLDGRVHISVPSGDEGAAQRAVDALYRREVAEMFESMLETWEPRVGQRAMGMRLRRMKSQWGNCNTATGVITLNTRLAKFAPEAMEYVVVHELVHFLERGHGPAFHAHMAALLPDHKNRRKLLREGP